MILDTIKYLLIYTETNELHNFQLSYKKLPKIFHYDNNFFVCELVKPYYHLITELISIGSTFT